MTKIMTASQMTDGQIDSVVDKLRAALRKHRDKISSVTAQAVLGTDNLGRVLLEPFCRLAELENNVAIHRFVTVNRSQTITQQLAGTDRHLNASDVVMAGMPNNKDKMIELVFFKPDSSARNYFISDDELEREFSLRGLRPADPFEVVAISKADPAFTNWHAYGTHWKDASGAWCAAAFNVVNGYRQLTIDRNDLDWHCSWWFVGVPTSTEV